MTLSEGNSEEPFCPKKVKQREKIYLFRYVSGHTDNVKS